MVRNYFCKRCSAVFQSHKKDKQYCSHACFAQRFESITKTCPTCDSSFTVAYRFRGQKTCGGECAKTAISKTLTTRVTKQCLACGGSYEATQAHKDNAKYCSYKCFLSTRKTQQSDVVKTCEGCKQEFSVPFTRSEQRFCGKSCANTGENNSMFGKPGSMTGRSAWNRGLTTSTDDRLLALGERIASVNSAAFASGERSHLGDKNPNYGHTSDTLTVEQRRRYSEAAMKRVLAGVSGYKTGHLTGTYIGIKAVSPVKFKSSWELAAMMWWDRYAQVKHYEYEPRVVELVDGRRALPDFRVTYVNGTAEYFEVKPTSIQSLVSVKEKLDLVRRALELEGQQYTLLGDVEIKFMMKEVGSEFNDAIKCYQSGS